MKNQIKEINPEDIEFPITNTSMEELSTKHPLLKEISKKFLNEENFTEIKFSKLTEKDIKNIKSVYFGMCAEVDHNIGKILKFLKSSGKLDNTMIIFTSDHGEMLGENNLWGKLGWWDSSYRIPLIIHIPGQQPRLVNEMTESVDLAPTILEWLEGDIPVDWNGQSLEPYLLVMLLRIRGIIHWQHGLDSLHWSWQRLTWLEALRLLTEC